ncbi:unnamed protein product [Larinioides sclopetarius]|uniref:DNA-directed RNA polymerase III subunit RPC4 n=1 Tax=Larinioides sclopetarius TaxID=280406 RepID=A0AAV2AC03_9ARAC
MDSSAPDSSSISLDMIRKTVISRRGGVRVRGGRLPPIRIRDVVPPSNKKVIAPKIPQRRIAIKKEIPEPFERTSALSTNDRKDFRKSFSRGRGQRVYIQTEGSFLEQGPAFRLKKETVVPHYERISRSSSRMKFQESKINAGQINVLLEEYDEKDEYLDYEDDTQPVRFPFIKKKSKPKIKEEILDNQDVKPKVKEEILDDDDIKPKIKEEILDNEDVKKKIKEEFLDNEDVKLKIKKEAEDDTDDTKVNWILPDFKTTKEEISEPKICSLMEAIKLSQEEDMFVLFQLPSCLPFKRSDDISDQPTKKDKNSNGQGDKVEKLQDEVNGTSFKDMPEGPVGKLQITKSGRMRLVFGSVDIAIESGVNEGSLAEVVSMSLANKDEGDFIVLGKIYHKMIMHPILTDSEKEIKSEETSE